MNPMTDDSTANNPQNENAPGTQGAVTDANREEGIVIGNIYEGTVTNITNFGAFVRLNSEEEGLVHISELANEFVTDINQYVTLGAKVMVKVLSRNAKKKLDLSIKQVNASEKINETPRPRQSYSANSTRSKNASFEDKLGQFLKKSEEKQIDIRRNLKQKQGIVKKRK
jgi:S1 RNA binding domain protein